MFCIGQRRSKRIIAAFQRHCVLARLPMFHVEHDLASYRLAQLHVPRGTSAWPLELVRACQPPQPSVQYAHYSHSRLLGSSGGTLLSKDQKRLGRGLSSLLSADVIYQAPSPAEAHPPSPLLDRMRASPTAPILVSVPVDSVRNNPLQPRRSFDERSLATLAESIRDRGALQPIVVRPAESGYELVAGERRLRAAKLAGITHLPAIIRKADDDELLELALIENIQRADLNPVERARAYRVLHTTYTLSHEDIAHRMGEDRATVTNYLRLLSLPEQVLEMIEVGKLTMGHGRALLGCTESVLQLSIAEQAATESWSVRQTEKAVARIAAGEKPVRDAPPTRPVIKDIEDRLSRALATKVRIQEGRRRHSGRLIIEYYGLEDFQRIAGILGLGDDEQ